MDFIKGNANHDRGSIWFVDLGRNHQRGSEQVGLRPAIIVSNNTNNKYSPNVNIVVATSKVRDKRLPVHVRADILRQSDIMCEQILTVSKSRLMEYVGDLSEDKINEIDIAIKIQLGLI